MSMPTYKLASRVKIPNFMTLTTFLIKTQIPIFLKLCPKALWVCQCVSCSNYHLFKCMQAKIFGIKNVSTAIFQ